MAERASSLSTHPEQCFVPPHLLIAEPAASGATLASLTETDLHDLWRRQLLGGSLLQTTDGEAVEVVHPGRYNRDAGPDFRRATIKVGGKILHGDVEIHLEARDWFEHGHHTDPAYNAVILHIALRQHSGFCEILRENGLCVSQILLDGHHLPASEPEPRLIAECPLARSAPEKIFATVRRAGLLRLQQKAMIFGEQLVQASWDQAVYCGMAEALGYDKNQEAFRAVAQLVPVDLLFSELRANTGQNETLLLEALLFGAAGFLQYHETALDEETRLYLAPRRELWERLCHVLRLQPLQPSIWRFFRLRPANFPPRRLAGLALLLRRFYHDGLLEHLLALAQRGRLRRKRLDRHLLDYFVVPAEGFWERHCDFQSRPFAGPAQRYGDLVGSQRAQDIVVNVILPSLWQYASQAEDAQLATTLTELYAHLQPSQSNLLTRQMAAQLAPASALRGQLARGAQVQQGLIYLQKLLCRFLRCEICLRLSDESGA